MSSASFMAPGTRPGSPGNSISSRPIGPRSGSGRPPSDEIDVRARLSPARRVARRTFDVTVSGLGLLALSPVLATIAAAVKLTSPGPVLYRQVRVGRNRRWDDRRASGDLRASSDRRRDRDRRTAAGFGDPFEIVKFRTMVVNAEEYGPQWSSEGDPRITPLGRFLRKTRLDELPQLWNVFRGDMSLIGPRPERPYFVEQFVDHVPRYRERLRIRPGITGQAQVRLDYDASVDDVRRKVVEDLDYLHHLSWRRDLDILVRTVWVVLTGKGAR
jgi:lipopolysaccharide/colanic/teichoic acid biosynthesis glycosyltransferase